MEGAMEEKRSRDGGEEKARWRKRARMDEARWTKTTGVVH